MENNTYRNVPDSQFIWHGEWADPEIIYKGHSFNYWNIEKGLYQEYCYECEMVGIEPDFDGFECWINEQGVDYIQDKLDAIAEYYEDYEEHSLELDD